MRLTGFQVQAHAANSRRELNHLLGCGRVEGYGMTSANVSPNRSQKRCSLCTSCLARAQESGEAQAGDATDLGRCGDRRHWSRRARRGQSQVRLVAREPPRVGRDTYRAIPSPMVRTRPVSWTSAPAVEPEMRDSRIEATSEAAGHPSRPEGQFSRCASRPRVVRLTGLGGSVGAHRGGALEEQRWEDSRSSFWSVVVSRR